MPERRRGASGAYCKGGSPSMSRQYCANHCRTCVYQTPVCPSSGSWRDDSKARRESQSAGSSLSQCKSVTVWKRASTTIGGAANSALTISCGIEGLLRIILASIITCGRSIWLQVSTVTPGPQQTTEEYISAGVTSVSKSQPFVHGS